MKLDWRRFWIAAGVYVAVLLGFLIFDLSLTLGKFHGLVFALYSAYFSGAFLLVMAVLAFLNRKRPERLRAYGFAALLAILALLLFWLLGSV